MPAVAAADGAADPPCGKAAGAKARIKHTTTGADANGRDRLKKAVRNPWRFTPEW